jgi:hypothetical protein
MKPGDRRRFQGTPWSAGMETGLPKDFVGHPVADSGKEILEQQQRF